MCAESKPWALGRPTGVTRARTLLSPSSQSILYTPICFYRLSYLAALCHSI
uniref:Uncharacterized protein n=1 Tax=Anguilla anguilla TaxID=7936 RepID=A0A0E9VUF7_ANGAN